MTDRDIERQELQAMFDRLDHEVDLLYQALDAEDQDMESDYAEKVVRSQLESIGEVVESMSTKVGDGEKISVTTPSQLGADKE